MSICSVTEQDGVTVVVPGGRLDSSSAKPFEDELLPTVSAGERPVVIDFSDVAYVSSAGLRVMLIAAKKSKAAGTALALSGLAPHVREVFDISGFSAFFTIFQTRDEAVRALG